VAGIDVVAFGRGVRVRLRVRPRSRAGLELNDGGLTLRVAAAPEKGRANEEARRALAAALGVAPDAVTLRTGAKARTKAFEVRGVEPAAARARLLDAARGPARPKG
jgi:uncharacterized protein YggU (UPF0235/DUF167 family)